MLTKKIFKFRNKYKAITLFITRRHASPTTPRISVLTHTLSHTLGGPMNAATLAHRRASEATQFRKVCRSKNSNGSPIPPVKWRTIALVNHYIKILYRPAPPECSPRHLPLLPRFLLPLLLFLALVCVRFSHPVRRIQAVNLARAHLLILTLHGVCGLFTGHSRLCAYRRSCVRTLAPRGQSIK